MPIMDEGFYMGMFKGAYAAKTKNGKDYFALTFAVDQQYVNNEWKAISEIEVSVRLYLTDKSFDWHIRRLRMLGFDGHFDATVGTEHFSHDFTSNPNMLICSHTISAGKVFCNWDLSVWVEDMKKTQNEKKPASQPIDEARLRMLRNKWKSSEANLQPPAQPAPAPQPSPVKMAEATLPIVDREDDEIPL